MRQRSVTAARSLEDSQAEARRWVERLGGQVYALDPKDDPAARQALADASERFTAAGSQVEQAKSVQQYRLAQQTAYEGLYYVRAARTSLGLDPGPELPPIPGQQQAGAVYRGPRGRTSRATSTRPRRSPGDAHPALLPGRHGRRPAGAAAAGTPSRGGSRRWSPAPGASARYLVASTLFAGMAGIGGGYDAGYDAGYADGGGDGGDARR